MATPIPNNEAQFSLEEIAQVTSATLIGAARGDIHGVTTDTRSDLNGKLFVALTGDRYDGHAYLHDAVARGAAGVLVERDDVALPNAPVLRVTSTVRALGDVAHLHRSKWGGHLVAIAGSAGKTTTRVAVETLLRANADSGVHATMGNLNNQVGVPMTLLGLTDQHRYAVIEVGTNAPGEVERLGEICSPNVSVLTLIGLEHTEGLSDLAGIEREEGRIFAVLGADGFAIGNGDDPRVMNQLQQVSRPNQRRTFGCQPTVDYRVSQQIADALDRTLVTIQRGARIGHALLSLETRLLGQPGAAAVAAAVAVADALGITIDAPRTNAALMRDDLGEAGRLKIHQLPDGTVLLDDCYNANPPSMLSSISLANSLAVRRASRLILVLGEMRELGTHSEQEHSNLGARLGQVARLIAVGEQAEPLHRSARHCYKKSELVPAAPQAADLLLSIVRPGDVILIKGSRGVHLETVVDALMAKKGYAA